MAGLPGVQVLLDDGTGTFPFDVSSRVRLRDGIAITRGRSDEQSQVSPSTLQLTLENIDGQMTVGGVSPTTRTNLATNGSFEIDTVGWASNATIVQDASTGQVGSASMAFTARIGTPSEINTAIQVSVTSGLSYTFSEWVKMPTAPSVTYFPAINWWDANGNILTPTFGSNFATTASFTRVSVTATAPAGAVTASLYPVFTFNPPTVADKIWIDGIMFEQSATLNSYIDGSVSTYASTTLFLDQRIRVIETVGATSSTRFTGYIDEAPITWPDGGSLYSTVQVTASDLLTRISGMPAQTPIPQALARMSIVGHWSLLGQGLPMRDSSGNGQPALKASKYQVSGAKDPLGFSSGPASPSDGQAGVAFSNTSVILSTRYAGTLSSGSVGKSAGGMSAMIQTTDTNGLVAQVSASNWVGRRVSLGVSGGVLSWTTSWRNAAGSVQTLYAANGSIPVNDGSPHVVTWSADVTGKITFTVDGVTDTTTYTVDGRTNNYTAWAAGYAMLEVSGTADPGAAVSGRLSDLAMSHLMVANTEDYFDDYAQTLLGFISDSTDQRIARYLGYVGIPSSQWSLETGRTVGLAAQGVNVNSTLDAINQVADTEAGLVFISGSGQVVFQNRQHRSLQTTPILSAPVDELDPGTTINNDKAHVLNSSAVSYGDSQVASATDSTSIGLRGVYHNSFDLLFLSSDDASGRARWEVAGHSTPTPRFASLTVDLLTLSATRQAAYLGLELSDRLALTGLPPQIPSALGDQVIEGWTETITDDSWAMTFTTTPWGIWQAWILGDAIWGVLGTTTRLGL